MLGWWHVLTRCLILPSQGSWDVLPPAGWQRQRDTASVPDKAVGATNEAAVTLQTEAQSLSQKLTLFPHGEVQCASNARCPSRSVCGSQDGAVGCHPGAVLHKNRGCKKDNFDWFFFSFCVWLNIQIYHIHRFFFFFKNFFYPPNTNFWNDLMLPTSNKNIKLGTVDSCVTWDFFFSFHCKPLGQCLQASSAFLKLISHSFSFKISIITKPPTAKRLSENACNKPSLTTQSLRLRGKTCIHQVKHCWT